MRQSIQATPFTLAVLSKNGLLSSWVAMEMTEAFNSRDRSAEKGFIGCYIDKSFLERGFVDEALAVVNNDLRQLEQLKLDRLKNRMDTRDINKDYSRLRQLSDSIDDIIGRLRGCICIDISGANLKQNLPNIVQAIKRGPNI
jgi:hypothetical protein